MALAPQQLDGLTATSAGEVPAALPAVPPPVPLDLLTLTFAGRIVPVPRTPVGPAPTVDVPAPGSLAPASGPAQPDAPAIPQGGLPGGGQPGPVFAPYPCPARLAHLSDPKYQSVTPIPFVVGPPDVIVDDSDPHPLNVDTASAWLQGKTVNCDTGTVLVGYTIKRDGRRGTFAATTPALVGWDAATFYTVFGLDGNVAGYFSSTGWHDAGQFDPNNGGGPFNPGQPGNPFPPGGFPGGGAGSDLTGLSIPQIISAVLGALGTHGGDVGGVIRAILTLLFGLTKISDKLGGLSNPVTDALGTFNTNLGNTLGGNADLLSSALAALGGDTSLATLTGADVSSAQASAGAVAAAPGVHEATTGAHLGLLHQIFGEIEKPAGALFQAIMGVFHNSIDANAEGLRNGTVNVQQVAGEAIGQAWLAGMTAHVAALALEAIPYTKHIGFTEFVGFISQFAGFDEITRPLIRPTLEHGLGLLASYEAGAKFRNRLPVPMEAKELASRRYASIADYQKVLRAHGVRDEWAAILAAHPYAEPRPREIQTLADFADVDPAWFIKALRRHGWSEEDVQVGAQAMQDRILNRAKTKTVDQLVTEYTDGRVTRATVETALATASLSHTSQLNLLQFADLKRRGVQMEKVGKAAVAQYVNDVVDRASCVALLGGLGFADGEISTRMVVADMQHLDKQLIAQDKELGAEIRKLQSASLANLKKQLRAGFLDTPTFVAQAVAVGYSQTYAEVVAELELLQGAPAHASTIPNLGLGPVEDTAKALAAIMAEQVKNGNVTRAAAELLLTQVGLQPGLLKEILDVSVVLGILTPGEAGLPSFGELRLFADVVAVTLELLAAGFGADSIFGELVQRLHLPASLEGVVQDLVGILLGIFTHGRGAFGLSNISAGGGPPPATATQAGHPVAEQVAPPATGTL